MPSSYRIPVTPFFEKDLKRPGKKDHRILEEIENLKKILEANPCHLSRKLDMRRLKGIKAGEDQFRIRTKQYQI